jgi:hypothetical protein
VVVNFSSRIVLDGPVTADTDPVHDDRLRTPVIQGFNILQWCSFAPIRGSGYHTSQALTISPAARSRGREWTSYFGIRIASRQAVLQMLESRNHLQKLVSGGFASALSQQLTAERPIRSTGLQIIAIPPFT